MYASVRAPSRWPSYEAPLASWCGAPASDARGVAHLRIEPEIGQGLQAVARASVHSERCDDVLHEDVAWSHVADDGEEGVHEVALVVASPLLAGDAVGLAGYAAADEIHATSEVGSGELVEIAREDRGRIQGLVFHPCHEDGRRVAVPLTETHQAGSGESELDAALEPADPGAHAEDAG